MGSSSATAEPPMLRRFRAEWLVLLLIGLSTLTIVNPLNVQDVTRIGLSRSLAEHGSLEIDRYHALTTDRAFRAGHWYSDKAPGVSLLAIPTIEGLRAVGALEHDRSRLPIWRRVAHIWLIRVLTAGIGLLATALLLGRAAEAQRRGYGAIVAITFALGTIAGPLGPTMFEHDLATAFAFGAFVLASMKTRRLLLAGALAGLAVLTEYQTALIVVVLAVYVALRFGVRRLLPFCLGGLPGLLALGGYNLAAFGSPFHLSYKYVANTYTERQRQGFFGIGTPSLHGAWDLFLSDRGLLVLSPVLVAAAAGLVLAWRRGRRAEAGVCIAVTILFLFADMGYFDPYGGLSPGPRFFAAALPFLALGLVEAYHRRPLATGLLALWSFSWTTYDAVTWATFAKLDLGWDPNTIFARMPVIGTRLGFHLVFVSIVLTVAYAAFQLARPRWNVASKIASAPFTRG